ncbi:hypothetical protein D6D13_07734, partial [Aureobasidium pullulans]
VSNLQVAPGVALWTSKSFEATHVAELLDSERILSIGIKPSDNKFYQSHRSRDLAPTLLFPSNTNRIRLENFYGRGSAHLEQRAGLYLCLEDGWSDAFTFIDGKGRDKLSTYRDAWCPWMRIRPPATLREVLGFWKMLVTDGIWSVDAQGVVGGREYLMMAKTERPSRSKAGRSRSRARSGFERVGVLRLHFDHNEQPLNASPFNEVLACD